jgi:DNA-3-methyladenine glycosylase
VPQPVRESYFRQPTPELARSLLGMLLVHVAEEGVVSGWIVETEAYLGPEDRAAHSFNNRRTRRTEVMFGPAGRAYTHLIHTHCLLNVVGGEVGCPQSVLIRALEPCSGIESMYKRRGAVRKPQELTNGPGKLTKALGIHMKYYGAPMFEPPLFIAEGRDVVSVEVGPRIGIANSGEAREYPYRFWESGNSYVSKG